MYPPPPSCFLLHPDSPSSIHLHLNHFTLHQAPSTTIQLISASNQLSATPSTLLEPKYCKDLGNFLKLGPKIHLTKKLSTLTKNLHSFYLQDPDFKSRLLKGFLNFDPQISFRKNLGQKSQSCSFCLKIGTHYVSRVQIPTLAFWISSPKSIFGQCWAKKIKLFVLPKNWHTEHLEDTDSYSDICPFD